MSIHREIWKNHYGEIPRADDGRSYEIHHIDGNRKNNSIENLLCITIREHYDIHLSQGDYGAAGMISKRMDLPADHMSKLQLGKKRPELVGKCGPKIGNVPWNKGKNGYKLKTDRSGKRFSSKITIEDVREIRRCYEERIALVNNDMIGVKNRNGVTSTYESKFTKEYAEKYGLTTTAIRKIIQHKTWKDGIIDVRSPK